MAWVGIHSCGISRCQICKFVSTGLIFRDAGSKQTFFFNYYFDCNSAGIVYYHALIMYLIIY